MTMRGSLQDSEIELTGECSLSYLAIVISLITVKKMMLKVALGFTILELNRFPVLMLLYDDQNNLVKVFDSFCWDLEITNVLTCLVECRVGIEIPKIEVRFQNLSIEGDAYVGTRALPTLWNSTLNTLEVISCSVPPVRLDTVHGTNI